MAYEGGKLARRLGLLALPVRAVKTDALLLEFDDEERECRFEIEGERVRAATITLSAGPVRFVRREPILGVTALESVGIEVDPRTQRLKRLPAVRLKAASRPT